LKLQRKAAKDVSVFINRLGFARRVRRPRERYEVDARRERAAFRQRCQHSIPSEAKSVPVNRRGRTRPFDYPSVTTFDCRFYWPVRIRDARVESVLWECMARSDPVHIRGRVKSLHDGRYFEPEVRHGGARDHDQGLTAVIEVDGSTPDVQNLLMLTTKREMPFSIQQLISCGIQPQRQRILTAKGVIAPLAAYAPVSASLIQVDTPGLTAVNPKRFTYHNIRRPLFGIEP
jgi:MlrC C-terminus